MLIPVLHLVKLKVLIISCDIGLLKPDLALYFHGGKQSNCLSYNGDERYETKQFQEKVEFYFKQLRSSSHQWKR